MNDTIFLRTISPKFISFEGLDGVGKTTTITHFCQILDDLGIAYVRTREPGGSDFAERLRALFLDESHALSIDTEILLAFTARADHMQHTILPALLEQKWVICDRFVDSTMAYQGFGHGAGEAQIVQKIDLLTQRFIPKMPDVSFWLDLDIHQTLARAGRRDTFDRFDSQDRAFFERVYQGFVHQHKHHSDRICPISAQGSTQEILTKIVSVLHQKYPNPKTP